MIQFTNDDLKQLKEFVKQHEWQPEYTIHIANGIMEALLARLEAAEKRSNEFSAMRIIEVEKWCAEIAYKVGRASMREDAARMAEKNNVCGLDVCSVDMAERIRAIPVEGK